MGQKGGGGRVGYGAASNKGPKQLGGPVGAGGRVRGGGLQAAVQRAAGGDPMGKTVSLASLQRQAGTTPAETLAEVDRLVAAGKAEYAFMSNRVASVLRSHGQSVVERDGRPVRGFKVTGDLA